MLVWLSASGSCHLEFSAVSAWVSGHRSVRVCLCRIRIHVAVLLANDGACIVVVAGGFKSCWQSRLVRMRWAIHLPLAFAFECV